MKPRLLDLFCKAGGCSMGYHLAGFEVTGVDIEPQPNYPFRFIQANALMFDLSGYDVIHASPPCQLYSRTNNFRKNDTWPDLIAPIRERLINWGGIYIIENVQQAPMPMYLMLCGTMFPELRVLRHRQFESNVLLFAPGSCNHRNIRIKRKGIVTENDYLEVAGNSLGSTEMSGRAMGINWMNRKELNQAIPPAYTRYIGEQIREIYL